MRVAERVVILLIIALLLGGALWLYSSVKQAEEERLQTQEQLQKEEELRNEAKTNDWREIYPNTIKIVVGEVEVNASVADELAERIRGLSNTPFLPEYVVKLFMFGSKGGHDIWMKDMNYPIDIIWATEDGEIVHIEENISPDTFPDSFSSPVPAWFVIETKAGFVDQNQIAIGDRILLPEQ